MRTDNVSACSVCGAPLSGRLDTFGAIGDPVCLACFVRVPAPEELESNGFPTAGGTITCIVCGEHTAYDKENAGYPGLYHCTSCGAWIDEIAGQTRKYNTQ